MTTRAVPGWPVRFFKENRKVKSEQSRCYEAQDSVYPWWVVSQHAHDFLPNNPEPYIEAVMSQDWFKEKFRHHRTVTTKKGKRPDAKASVTHVYPLLRRATIVICQAHRSTRQLCEMVCLHELAHAVTRKAGHGQDFRANFVWLVRQQMGYKQAQLLRQAFIERDLPFRDWSMENQRR